MGARLQPASPSPQQWHSEMRASVGRRGRVRAHGASFPVSWAVGLGCLFACVCLCLSVCLPSCVLLAGDVYLSSSLVCAGW